MPITLFCWFILPHVSPSPNQNERVRDQLVGTWNVVGELSDDGKISKKESPYKFVITNTTMSMKFEDSRDCFWEASYRVVTWNRVPILQLSVTRAPCLSGETECGESFSIKGNRLTLGSLVLQRQGR